MTPPLVCFDLDGCLVDSRAPIAAALNHGLVAVGAPKRDPADLHGRIGAPLLAMFRDLLAEADHDTGRAHDAVVAYREVYGDLAVANTVAVPGMPELVADLARAGTGLLVVTTKPVEFTEPILAAVGLAPSFEAVFAPSLADLEEPKATTLERALAHAGIAAPTDRARAWMVGDRHHDVAAGRTCGTRTAGVTWGSGARPELVDAGAEVVVDHPHQLAAVLWEPGESDPR